MPLTQPDPNPVLRRYADQRGVLRAEWQHDFDFNYARVT